MARTTNIVRGLSRIARHTALIVAAAAVVASALSFDAASAARAEPVIVCQVGGSCNTVCR